MRRRVLKLLIRASDPRFMQLSAHSISAFRVLSQQPRYFRIAPFIRVCSSNPNGRLRVFGMIEG